MSLHDKIDDAVFGDEEERAERDQYLDAFASLIDSTEKPHTLGPRLLIALGVEAAIALLAILKPGLIVDHFGEYLLFVPVVAFANGFFIAFSLYRMYQFSFARGERPADVKSGVMSGFSGYDARSGNYTIWFVGAAGALLNVAVIAALAIFF
jgi:hypothetical protein